MSDQEKVTLPPMTRALAALIVEAFEQDFPEGRGLDAESSALCMATDLAEVIADGGDPTPLLADPGLFEMHDRLRSALQGEGGEAATNQTSTDEEETMAEKAEEPDALDAIRSAASEFDELEGAAMSEWAQLLLALDAGGWELTKRAAQQDQGGSGEKADRCACGHLHEHHSPAGCRCVNPRSKEPCGCDQFRLATPQPQQEEGGGGLVERLDPDWCRRELQTASLNHSAFKANSYSSGYWLGRAEILSHVVASLDGATEQEEGGVGKAGPKYSPNEVKQILEGRGVAEAAARAYWEQLDSMTPELQQEAIGFWNAVLSAVVAYLYEHAALDQQPATPPPALSDLTGEEIDALLEFSPDGTDEILDSARAKLAARLPALSEQGAGPKYPPAERLVESLRWAVGYIDRRGPFKADPDQSEGEPGPADPDWIEWAAAHDWLKDAEMASEQGEAGK